MAKKNKAKQPNHPSNEPAESAELTQPQTAYSVAETPFDLSDWLRRNYMLSALFFIILAIGLYANTLNNEYALDDGIVIGENNYTKMGLKGVPILLRTDAMEGALGDVSKILPGGRYRPLSIVTFAIEYQFFGMNPRVSHAVNVLLFGLLCFLLFRFLNRFLFPEQPLVSWIATLLFVVHPIHTESVANIKGRDEIMSLIFLVLTLHLLFVYLENPSGRKQPLYLSIFVFFLALLSKENGLAFFAILPMTVFLFTKLDWKETLKASAPHLGVIAFYFGLRLLIVGFQQGEAKIDVLNDPYVGRSFQEKYGTIVVCLGRYMQLALFPNAMTYDYSYPQIAYTTFSDPDFYSSLVPNLILLAAGLWLLFKRNIAAYPIMFYLFSMFLVSNIPINLGAFLGERLLFQPSVGVVIGLGMLFAYLINKMPKGTAQFGLLVAFCLPLAVLGSYRTITRNPDWKNNETLFMHDIAVSPKSAKTNKACGEVLLRKARALPESDSSRNKIIYESISYFKKAQELHPQFLDAFIDCATAYYVMGEYESSELYWNKAKHINPNHSIVKEYENYFAEAYYVKGVNMVKDAKGDVNKLGLAEYMIQKSLAFNPAYHKSWNALGMLKFNGPKKENAITYWNHAVTGDPNNVEYLYNLGGGYFTMKDYTLAQATWSKAYAIDPNYDKGKLYQGLVAVNQILGMPPPQPPQQPGRRPF